MAARCPRCLELEDDVRELRQQLAAVGQYVVASPAPELGGNVERELARWLSVNPQATPAAAFRAGWARLARVAAAALRDWEARWWRQARENDRLRSRMGVLLAEISRLRDRG